MSTAQITNPIMPSQPRVRPTLIGAYYVLTILTGAFILLFHGRLAFIADLTVGICYVALTALLYGWSASSNQGEGAASTRND